MKQGFSALVADDDEFSRRTAVRMLRLLGAGDVIEASDGDQALLHANARDGALDLVVCDLRMPQLDGIETLRGLAASHRSALFVLASATDSRLLRSARAMATTFGIESLGTIEKPVTMQKLRDIFASAEDKSAAPLVAQVQAPAFTGFTADDLARALAGGEFIAHFQPKVALGTRQVVGAEALARWHHPTHGILAPNQFMSGLQQSGLMGELTDVVIAQALTCCAGWNRAGLDLQVSVNLPVSLLIERDAPQRLEALAKHHCVAPEQLTLEVTEDGWLRQESVAREVLTRLRLRGFGLAIDDFGTGYSSVQQLLDAPFSEMKLDQSFVRAAPQDEEAAAVIASSVSLAHRLGMQVVAEGAETEAHWAHLAQAGCDFVQGYVVARAMPAGAFADWLAAWTRLQGQSAARLVQEAGVL